MRMIFKMSFLLLICFIASCTNYDLSRRIVQQGNLLPQDKVRQLRPGMSKEAVVNLMGTSLVGPLFSDNRLDYAYTWRKGSGPMLKRKVVLYFSNNSLVKIEDRPYP